MKYLKSYKFFEGIIVPDKLDNNTSLYNYDDLVKYGKENGFEVVNYDDFFDSLSTDLVNSSNIITGESRRITRARAIFCFSPLDRFRPDSPTPVSYFLGSLMINSSSMVSPTLNL